MGALRGRTGCWASGRGSAPPSRPNNLDSTTKIQHSIFFYPFVSTFTSAAVYTELACRLTLRLLTHRASVPVRAIANTLNRMAQLCHLVPKLLHLPLQGLSDVGPPLRHVILTQVHVLLAHIGLQAFHFLPMLAAAHKPAASTQQAICASSTFICPRPIPAHTLLMR